MPGKLFGTDGIRGLANKYPIIPGMIQKFGMASGHFFKSDSHQNIVVIAKDTRLSGYMVEQALTSGLLSVGFDVVLVGPMPTSAVSFLIKSLRARFGIMISASHNPYHDNGIKIFDNEGYKLADSCELELEKLILSENINEFLVSAEKLGRAKRLEDAPGRYVEHVKRSFPKGLDLSGLRIVIDCANGAGYKLAPTIFWELGAEVIAIGTSPDGTNINLDCGATHPISLSAKVKETRADIGIALDGDADRVLICDEKGDIINTDHLIAMIAVHMKKDMQLTSNSIVVTHMSNLALDEYLQSHDITVHRTQIGDRYVSEKMREVGSNLGAESSGHIIFSDYSKAGDGIIAALQLLAIMRTNNMRVSQLSSEFNLNPQINTSYKFKGTNPLENNAVQNSLKKIEKKAPECKFLIRKSGTENLVRVLVEGKDSLQISGIADEIMSTLRFAD